jgi:DNA replication protein DnaC
MQARKCLYLSAASLVQQLLIAKGKLNLNNFIKRLDKYEVLVIDDISYIPYAKEES